MDLSPLWEDYSEHPIGSFCTSPDKHSQILKSEFQVSKVTRRKSRQQPLVVSFPLHSLCRFDLPPQISAGGRQSPGPDIHSSKYVKACGSCWQVTLEALMRGSLVLISLSLQRFLYMTMFYFFLLPLNSKERPWFNLKIHVENMSSWRISCQGYL